MEKVAQRLLARERIDDVLVQLGKDRADGDQLVGVVVDDQDVDVLAHRSYCVSQSRMVASRRSVSTGLAM